VLSADDVDARRHVVRLASLIAAAPSHRAVAEGFMTYYEEITNPPGLLDSAAVRLERARAEEPLQLLAPSLIRLAFLQEDYAAVRTVARQIDTDALDAWSLYRIGEAFAKSGEHEVAIGYLSQAVALAPDHLRFRRQLGAANGEAGQFHAALAEYDAILAEDPTFEDAYNNRGFVRVQIGDIAEAEADFLAALRLNPNAEMALANVASLYFNTGRQAEARAYAERLVALFPEDLRYRQFWVLLNGAGI
jgi:tetratricopeptide (TPR) repeat protein